MATQYTSFLGLALPVTGELSGSWGDVVNDSITSLLDSAISGTTSLTTDADVTLTTTDGVANEARQAIILWNPASGTVTRNITAPAQSKTYTVINASGGTQSIVFRGAGPTTGVTIIKGESAVVAWNGSDFIKISNTGGGGSFTNVTISGTTTLSGLTASTALALNASKEVVSVTNTGTGNNVLSASPTLTGTLAAAAANFSGAVALGDAAADNITVNGTVTSNLIFTDNTYDIGASGATRPRNLYLAGDATVGGNIVLTGSLDLTNLEVTNIKAKDGTAGMQIADSTGVVSFTANPVISGGTANGVAYLNGSKVLTTGSALTFDGTNLGVGTASPACELDVYAATNSELRLTTLSDGYLAAGQFSSGAYIGTSSSDATAGVLRLATAGTERLRITSTGLVGIGTASPGAELQVNNASASAGRRGLRVSASGWTSAYGELVIDTTATKIDLNSSNAAYPLSFSIASAEGMRLTSTGLGIGTSSPTNKLSVTGNANITGNTTLGDASTDTVTVNGYMGVGGAANSAIGVQIASTGLVGAVQYGANSQVVGNSAATTFIAGFASFPQTADTAFTCADVAAFYARTGTRGAASTVTSWHGLYVADQVRGSTNNYGITSLVSSGTNKWNIYASGTAQNYFAGNVGIGTSSPAAALHVAAQVSDAEFARLGVLAFPERALRLSSFTNGGYTNTGVLFTAPGATGVESTTPAIAFATGTSERLRITASGNVGIGTSSPQSRLHIATGGVINQVTGTAGQNAAFEFAGNGNTISATGYLVGQAANGDAYVFQRAANPLILGTSNLERLRIDSSGNVGIGTSAPIYNLDVRGVGGTTLNLQGSSGNATVRIVSLASGSAQVQLISSAGTQSIVGGVGSVNNMAFKVNDTERARIDASGNLLVGRTAALNNGTISVTGTSKQAITATVTDNGNSIFQGFNSAGSAVFQVTGNGTIQHSSTLYPLTDAAVQIGTSAARYSSLYLSNGVYLGGTVAANLLDDYEEGTWTPTYSPATAFTSITYDAAVTAGKYTKIGNLVVCAFNIRTSAISGGSGDVLLGGLPFTAATVAAYGVGGGAIVQAGNVGAFAGDVPSAVNVIEATATAGISYRATANGNTAGLDVSDLATGATSNFIYGTFFYYV